MTDPAHWESVHHASEISAFRLALPLDALKMVKSSIVPMVATTSDKNNGNTSIGNPWIWQRKLLSHFAGQDILLAERINFMKTCKQKLQESVAEFEARCKYHGSKCEYNKRRIRNKN